MPEVLPQKFKRGQRVEILSRRTEEDPHAWENKDVGEEALIMFSRSERPDFAPNTISRDDYGMLYCICVVYGTEQSGITWKTNYWYEERFLKLICSNEDRGKKELAAMGK